MSEKHTSACHRMGAAALAWVCLASWAGAEAPARPSDEPSDYLTLPPKAASVRDHFSLVTLGDLLYSHPFAHSADAQLQKVFTLIRSGDVVIANREGIFFDLKSFKGQGYGDGLLWGEAALGEDMKAMGIGMVSMAISPSCPRGASCSLRPRTIPWPA